MVFLDRLVKYKCILLLVIKLKKRKTFNKLLVYTGLLSRSPDYALGDFA